MDLDNPPVIGRSCLRDNSRPADCYLWYFARSSSENKFSKMDEAINGTSLDVKEIDPHTIQVALERQYTTRTVVATRIVESPKFYLPKKSIIIWRFEYNDSTQILYLKCYSTKETSYTFSLSSAPVNSFSGVEQDKTLTYNFCKSNNWRCVIWNFEDFNARGYTRFNIRLKMLRCPSNVLEYEQSDAVKDHFGSFKSLLREGTFSDVTIKNKEKEFKVHKAILIAKSSAFQKMLEMPKKGTDPNVIILDDIDSNILELLLDFIYTASIPPFGAITNKLFIEADMYQIESLKKACASQIIQSVNVQNAAEHLVLMDLYQMEEHKTSLIHFISNNFDQVFKTDGWVSMTAGKGELMQECIKFYFDNRKK